MHKGWYGKREFRRGREGERGRKVRMDADVDEEGGAEGEGE